MKTTSKSTALFFACLTVVLGGCGTVFWVPTPSITQVEHYKEPLVLTKMDSSQSRDSDKWETPSEPLSEDERKTVIACLMTAKSPRRLSLSPSPLVSPVSPWYVLEPAPDNQNKIFGYFSFSRDGSLNDHKLPETESVLLRSVIANIIARINGEG